MDKIQNIAEMSFWGTSMTGSKETLKVGHSPCKKNCVICFIESPLKILKNVFYFIWKSLFVLNILKFLSWPFGHVGKKARLER